jgi:hypothetical protein
MYEAPKGAEIENKQKEETGVTIPIQIAERSFVKKTHQR